jgi:hypothetical protein
MDILPEAASESPPPSPPPNETGGNSTGMVSLNSAIENADSQTSTCYKKRNMIQNHLRLTEQFTESQAGSCMPQEAV